MLPKGIYALYQLIKDNEKLESLPNFNLSATSEQSVADQLLDIGLHPEKYPQLDMASFDASCAEAAEIVIGWDPGEEAYEDGGVLRELLDDFRL